MGRTWENAMPIAPTTPQDQLTAWTLAHRVILAHLVKVVAQYIPAEGDAAARNATVTMLQATIPQMLGNLDSVTAERLTVLAQQEVDRIFVAPVLPSPPP
jgi:hypothetical protein